MRVQLEIDPSALKLTKITVLGIILESSKMTARQVNLLKSLKVIKNYAGYQEILMASIENGHIVHDCWWEINLSTLKSTKKTIWSILLWAALPNASFQCWIFFLLFPGLNEPLSDLPDSMIGAFFLGDGVIPNCFSFNQGSSTKEFHNQISQHDNLCSATQQKLKL